MSQSKNGQFPINVEIVLDHADTYTKLTSLQLYNLPAKGDYYGDYASKKAYEIKAIIHEDLYVILVVAEPDKKLSKVMSLIYNLPE